MIPKVSKACGIVVQYFANNPTNVTDFIQYIVLNCGRVFIVVSSAQSGLVVAWWAGDPREGGRTAEDRPANQWSARPHSGLEEGRKRSTSIRSGEDIFYFTYLISYTGLINVLLNLLYPLLGGIVL